METTNEKVPCKMDLAKVSVRKVLAPTIRYDTEITCAYGLFTISIHKTVPIYH